jgi:hypothetical protein
MVDFTVQECIDKIKGLQKISDECEDQQVKLSTMIKLAGDSMSEKEKHDMELNALKFYKAVEFHKLMINVWQDHLQEAYLKEIKSSINQLLELLTTEK